VRDSLQISVRPDGVVSNIEVTAKSAQATADAEPTALSFRNTIATAGVLPTVLAASLPVEGTPLLVSDLVARLQACYALPVADRVSLVVNSAVPSTSTVKSGMFRDSATALKFDRSNLEYLLPNGELALTYRWTDSVGNTDNDQVIARKVGNKLVLVGNQYQYEANVRPLVLMMVLTCSQTTAKLLFIARKLAF
jgi:hypothetical protein